MKLKKINHIIQLTLILYRLFKKFHNIIFLIAIEYDLNYKSDTKWVEKMNSPIPEIFDLHEVEAKEL